MSWKNRPCFTFSIDGACPEIALDVFNIDNGVVKAKWVKWIVNFFLEGFQGIEWNLQAMRGRLEPLQWCVGTVGFVTSMVLTLLSVDVQR